MLHIFFADPETLPIIQDVEYAFSRLVELEYPFNDKDRKLVDIIERGELLDGTRFRDRFGYELPVSALSTGCKAAIVTNHLPDRLIDLRECGKQSRSAIIAVCEEGNVIMDPDNGIEDCTNCCGIQVSVEGQTFTDMSDLLYYFEDVRARDRALQEGEP